MSIKFLTVKNCRALLIASLISGGGLLSVNPAFAGQAAPGVISNTATAEFTDAGDTGVNPTSQKIVSDTVTVTVAEIAGITATGIATSSEVSRTKVVFFDFKISNVGNDPTQFFIPGKPSSVKLNTTDITASATIGSLQVIAYNATGTGSDTLINKNNVVPTAGSTTGDLPTTTDGTTAIPSKSIPSEGYIIVRVPVTVPLSALAGDKIAVTLGNATGQNVPYVSSGNDLYTQDNADTDNITGETTGVPANGDTVLRRQEASAVQEETVIDPLTKITISGTVYDDRDNSGATGFANIFTTGELGTNAVFGTSVVPVRVILVDVTNDNPKVLKVKTLATADNGAYSFTDIFAATDVKIFLSTDSTIAVGNTLTTAQLTSLVSVPTGWRNTAPTDNSFRTAANITQDFGIRQKASLLLLKRITKINGTPTTTNDSTDDFNTAVGGVQVAGSTINWPPNYIKGLKDAGKVKPGDTVEYTIYFINNQGTDAGNIKICDSILGSQTFKNGAYPGTTDIELKMGTDTALGLTTAIDTIDRARSYAGNAIPSGCNLPLGSKTPGIAVDITGIAASEAVQPALPSIPGATGAGIAGTNVVKPYGLIRFTTTIDARPAPAAPPTA